jgi:uncharacterized membrane protein
MSVMKLSWRVELVQLAIVAALFVVAAAAWPLVPDRIPIHWNLEGEADGYGGKFSGLLLLPLVTLGVYLLLVFLPRVDPGYRNYQLFATAYNAIRITIIVFLAAVYAVIVLVALGYRVNVSTVIGLGMGILFGVLGLCMRQIRPNWFVGVRTPWTLTSKLSWEKTHRLAGWLFIAMGLFLGAWALVPTVWMFAAAMSFVGVAVAWIIAYSYVVWRKDPERVSPPGGIPGRN